MFELTVVHLIALVYFEPSTLLKLAIYVFRLTFESCVQLKSWIIVLRLILIQINHYAMPFSKHI